MVFGRKKHDKAIQGSYMATLIEHQVKAQGGDVEALLRPIGLSEASLHKRKFYLTTAQYQQLILQLQTTTSAHALAFRLIEHVEVTQHGILGLLIMCGLTIRQAIKALLKFYHIQSNLVSFRFVDNKEVAKLIFVPQENLGEAEQFTLEMCMATFYKTKKQLLADQGDETQVSFSFAKTDDMVHHQDFLCG